MPPDVGRPYERARAGVASGGAAVKPPVVPAARAIRPPPSEDAEPGGGGGGGGGGLRRIPFWIAVGALGAWWLRRPGGVEGRLRLSRPRASVRAAPLRDP